VKRLHELAHYDAGTIHAILDAMPVAHVGYLVDGAPFVTPTLQWREGDRVYWHGSAASRFLKRAMDHDVCLTVTITDGMVLARSGLNSSVNYRSVMVFGRAEAVSDSRAKERHLETMMERMFPGRWATLRPATAQELKATTVLSLPIAEASAKVATGMPKDDEADYAWPVWAGVVPIRMEAGPPETDPRTLPDLPVPEHATRYRIG
jgi:nitroimidazol reductase NimA-like FMN-containing flavoprotein (pyridoxamine 5'-phosphate oxidase superfamily)